ncbi:MAG: hypothetical protein M3220_16020 [Chloroflexota bacterium]|nr:hypothetical protein [Chloroflexota bacterium]
MLETPDELLRRAYLPDTVRVLFIGESPPAGGTFFYAADSNLSRYTQQAFSEAYRREWESGEEFLRFFQARGCYLDDLCLIPVNRMERAERQRERSLAVPSLAERMARYRPLAVISVMTATRPHIESAIAQANLAPLPTYFMPFPTFGNQHRYVERLSSTLLELRDKSVLE